MQLQPEEQERIADGWRVLLARWQMRKPPQVVLLKVMALIMESMRQLVR